MRRNALQIETGSNGHMMQMGLTQSHIGRAPQPRGTHRLCNRALDPCAPVVAVQKRGGALLSSPVHQGVMDRLLMQLQLASCGSSRTLLPHRTGSTHLDRKADHLHRLVVLIQALDPREALDPLRTARRSLLPLELEILYRIATVFPRLPTRIGRDPPHHLVSPRGPLRPTLLPPRAVYAQV